MMKFLVIGGSSFIGVYVVDELLSRGAEVVATGRNERFATHYEEARCSLSESRYMR